MVNACVVIGVATVDIVDQKPFVAMYVVLWRTQVISCHSVLRT